MMETEEFLTLASLAISPNLQALLEFDDRFRWSGECHGRPETTPADPAQLGQYPSRRQQEVPTVSLPPPRRKKSAVTDVPMTRTISETQSVSSPTNTYLELAEFGGLGEMVFARPEDVDEEMELERKYFANPYLNSPPRHFYHLSDDGEEGNNQPPVYCTLERTRSMRRPIRIRSSSAQSPVERLASTRQFASLGRNRGSRPKERGKTLFIFPSSFFSSYICS